jgi:hypothetical protein
MKKRVAAVLALLFATSAFGQGGFELATPAQPLGDSLIVWDGHNGTTLVTVAGHWEDTLDLIHGLARPSVSAISCDRSKAVCEEEHAFIKAMGNTFRLSATLSSTRSSGGRIRRSSQSTSLRLVGFMKF